MRKKLIYCLFAAFFFAPFLVQAQEEEAVEAGCLTADELRKIMIMDTLEKIDVFMADRGYIPALSSQNKSDHRYDTISDIVLSYKIQTYNYPNDGTSSITIYFSEDGLTHMVEDIRPDSGDCSLYNTFQKLNFQENRVDHIIAVDYISKLNKPRQFLMSYTKREDNYYHFIMRDEDERTFYAGERRSEKVDEVYDQLDKAMLMTQYHSFAQALRQIDSIDTRFVSDDTLLTNARQRIMMAADKYYIPMIFDMADSDIERAIDYCDTLLPFSTNTDSVNTIKKLLRSRSNGEFPPYRKYRPDVYDSIIHSLHILVNNEIRSSLVEDPQGLRVKFTFKTDTENKSFGEATLWPEKDTRPKNVELFKSREKTFNTRLAELYNSPLIVPVKDHGITVFTEQKLEAEMKWYHFREFIVDQCPPGKDDLAPFIKMIEDQYFTTYTTQHLATGDTTIAKRRIPSKSEYTMGVTHKTYLGETYTDVSLMSYKTPGALSWVPSLIIPGLATSRQGEPHSVAARALPFFLFAGIATWGFVHEANATELYNWDDTESHAPWEYKNFGTIVGAVGASVAATIYIVDLVQAISNSVNNMKHSKKLRDELRKGSVILQSQDVPIWTGNGKNK
ncbi:MAG: hypothetical protein IJR26_01440 [Bacteroidales bacterium]|nr:hypothetical protein [Bacteroidales bacterium]